MAFEPDDEDLYPTPEAAALAGWASTPSAQANLQSVEVNGDQAIVVIKTSGDTERAFCRRPVGSGRWWMTETLG
jgi:hypothetical protein